MNLLEIFSTTSEPKSKDIGGIVKLLRAFIGHDNWFIAGSYANPNIKYRNCNDLDVFFHTEKDFLKVKLDPKVIFNETKFAITVHVDKIFLPVQLVNVCFGDPKEIFKEVDLNICKHAVLSNGLRTSHPSTRQPMAIVNPNARSFSRIVKYVGKMGFKDKEAKKVLKNVVDTYIEDSSILPIFYDGENPTPANIAMFEALRHTQIFPYLLKQAELKSPELLI